MSADHEVTFDAQQLRSALIDWTIDATRQQLADMVMVKHDGAVAMEQGREQWRRRYDRMAAQAEQNLAQYHRAVGIQQETVRLDAVDRHLRGDA